MCVCFLSFWSSVCLSICLAGMTILCLPVSLCLCCCNLLCDCACLCVSLPHAYVILCV